ncbi:pyrroline-5-carboxylate reductase [Cupriavidus plantarum]|uniref:pyrroline-5-carboxylate reductase n=1 Tax=Cupriavidus plantarum TaxID=942865 RepID=UPI000E220DA9|nr:pyrroline-5-carboxylate reductase [Cupriavidus plantarum]REE93490.1 pyrroline-5-carboxylate reductase [Cupriavidus plantarum]
MERNLDVAFVGGGSMATALIGGLVKGGVPPASIHVVDPLAAARARLADAFGVSTAEAPSERLGRCDMVVWAVKPQHLAVAAGQAAPFTANALHVSVAAGVDVATLQRWIGATRVVRAMPNTPALIGMGITGLFAADGVNERDRSQVEMLVASTGRFVWMPEERLIDAVTAVSGSGPAYIFYVMESMVRAGVEMGLSNQQATELVGATVAGAAALAAQSGEPLESLRARVTSRGGTTFAAIESLQSAGLQQTFIDAMWAANRRAADLIAQQAQA